LNSDIIKTAGVDPSTRRDPNRC